MTAPTLEDELARVAAREPDIGAWVIRHSDDELRRRVATLPQGPLHGLTLGVKDIIDTSDLGTERGSPIYAGRRTSADAACVALARAAGALVVGKTVTTEFAFLTAAGTANPHDVTRTPGGSSSGSAAAVADEMVRMAFGTQTVGSVIRPAAYCGVFGFKASHQLVPLAGVGALSPSLDTLGWFARDTADISAMLEALAPVTAAADDADPTRPLRIGKYRSHQWDHAAPEAVDALDQAAERLRAAGADVADVDPIVGLANAAEAATMLQMAESSRVLAWERQHHAELLSDLLRRVIESGSEISDDEYRAAQLIGAAARHDFDTAMTESGLDALLTPSAPGEAPAIKTTGDPVFCRVWTFLGAPAMHLPVGSGPNGLPVGAQLIGHRWRDRALVKVGQFAEGALAR
jgi:Asp-tRNA(Asn)/Glu-tRNA(Gln) amidotransferase A subunit family amidase